jgi:WD40 repeat protein
LRGDLDWIVMRCLEKDRTRRYETANSLAMDVQRHLGNETVLARPPSANYRLQKLVRRNKLAFAAAGAVVVTLIFGILLSSWQAVRATRAEGAQRLLRQEADKNRQIAQANEQTALNARAQEAEQRRHAEQTARGLRRLLYVGDMSKAFQAIRDGDLELATRLMTNYFHQPDGEDLRGWEWRRLWQLCQTNEHKIFTNTGQSMNAVVDQIIRVVELASNKAVTNLSGVDGDIDSSSLAFSPDGRLLAAKGGHIVRAWSTEIWQEVFQKTIGLQTWKEREDVLFSPDGKTLATRMSKRSTHTAPADDGVGFWDIQSGRLLTVLPSPDYWLGMAMKYSPGGNLLALSDGHKIEVRDARSLRPITNLIHDLLPFGSPATFRVMSIAISRNLMAAGYRLGEIKIWDTETWAELASWRAHPSFLAALDFSPDGKLLASGGNDCRIQVWDLATVLKAGINSTSTRPQTTLYGHTDQIRSVMFAPDGRSIVSCSFDGTVRRWSLPSPDRPIPLFEAKPADDKMDWWFLEDGKHAVYADQNWQLFLADLSGATAPQPLKSPKIDDLDLYGAWEVSPDGKTLAIRKNGSVQLWSLETGELKRTMKGAGQIPFAQGGRFFISSSGGEIRIEDLGAERDEPVLTATIKVPESSGLVLSGDGRVLAARLSRTQIGFWGVPDGHFSGAIDVPRGLNWEQFTLSHDGRWLAYCTSPEKALVLWDLISRHSTKSPMNDVTSAWGWVDMAFAPDGKTLVLVTADISVFFWNVATLREIIKEENFAGNYVGAKFSANGEYLSLPLTLRRAPPLAEIEEKERAKAEDRLAAAREAGK